MKRIAARFYSTSSGNEPVRQWLLDLASPDRRIVGTDIATVEFGWPIGMPISRALHSDILEVRSTIKNGKVEARTYFAIEQETMILLHAKEGKTGQREAIELAIRRLADHRQRAAGRGQKSRTSRYGKQKK